MIPESGIMERQRQIKGLSPGSADLSPSTIHRWWSFFPIRPQNALLCLQLKTKMVSSHSYTSEEVLNEMFADAESDLNSKSGESEDLNCVEETDIEDRTEESDQSDEQLTETDHEVNARGLGTTYGSGMNFSEPYLTMLTHQSCH